MENSKSGIKLSDRTTKYIIFICIGLVLIIAGSSFGGEKKEASDSTETRLAEILCKIDGVGETFVMLNYEDEKAVGAIIVSKGAGSALVRQKITAAASAALGIGTNKIEVFEKN